MMRTRADTSGGRIAVLGAASPAGAHVKAALADRGVSGGRVGLFGRHREVAVLSEYDGEARLVQRAEELDAAAYAAVFVCEPEHEGRRLASASGTLVIDLTGSAEGAPLAGTSSAAGGARIVAVPHPVTTMLTALLAPIHRAIGVMRVSVFVLRPASDFGDAGLEELRDQTVHLLRFETTPTEVFGRQLAFNIVPEHLFPSGEREAGTRIVRECRALMDAPTLPFVLTQALVPVFYGHAIAAEVDLAHKGRDEVLAALRQAPGVEIAADSETGASLDAPEGPGLVIARMDVVAEKTVRAWALGSEAGATAAARAVALCVEAGVL